MNTRAPLSPRWLLVERILLAVGLACGGYFGLTWIDMRFEQARENRELDRILASRTVHTTPAAQPVQQATARIDRGPTPRTVLGRLEIPRLGVSAMVREGDDASTLRRAVGHIPGTSMPGEQGNVGLAAHRDTFFSRLKDIRRQDEIRFTSADGVQHYIVEQTRIVDPTDIEVLDPTSTATMTLVTCYPFEYIGSAPQRFVVRAVRRDAGTSGTVAAAAAPNPATIQVRESETIAKPIGRAKARAAAPRAIKTSVKPPHNARRNSNAFARFFKAAARGLGFAPRESREAAQNESPDPRPPGR